MNNLFFWNKWRASYRFLYLFGLLLLLAATSFFLFYYLLAEEAVISWQKVGEIEPVKVVVDTFTKNFFSFSAEENAFIILETFEGSNLQIHFLPYYCHLFFLLSGFLFFMTALSDLGRLGYFLGVGVVVIFFASMQLEVLGIFAQLHEKAFLLLIFLAYIPLSYYFHFFNRRISFPRRFLYYALLTAALLFIAHRYGQKNFMALYPSAHGLFVPLILAMLFIGFNAHENIRGFLVLVSFGRHKHNFRHLTILVVIYLLNLVYSYLKLNKGVDWGIFYIHPFFLLISTTFLGIWGMRASESRYRSQMNFAPTGAFLYLGLALITLSGVGFALGTGNTPMIEVYEDASIYAHFTWGAALYAYIIANFFMPLSQGLPVHKIFYKPPRLSFSTSYFFGFVLAVILFLRSGMAPYKQSFAAYYNALADLSFVEKDIYAAKQYYNLALGYDTRNHRSYYALASIAKQENKPEVANIFFDRARRKTPTPFEYANIANHQRKEGKILEALLTLQEGIKKFPKSGELQNNLAVIFSKTEVADSAFFYFDAAQKFAKQPEVPAANLYTLLVRQPALRYLDTAYQWHNKRPYIGKLANRFAFYNTYQRKKPEALQKTLLPDSILHTPALCYLYNYTLNQAAFASDSLPALLKFYENQAANADFANYLRRASALLLFKKNDRKAAFQTLKEAYRHASFTETNLPNRLGLWYYQCAQYAQAVPYFRIAWQKGNQDAGINLGLALSELTDKTEARTHWQKITESRRSDHQKIAADMLQILDTDTAGYFQKTPANDLRVFRYLHYHRNTLSEQTFTQIFGQLSEPNYQAAALAERILETQSDTATHGKLSAQLKKIYTATGLKAYAICALLAHKKRSRQHDPEFEQLLADPDFQKTYPGLHKYYRASQKIAQKKPDKAIALLRQALKILPTNPEPYQDLTTLYYHTQQKHQAYLLALEGIKINPQSLPLWKNYLEQCLKQGYDSFAEDALAQISTQVSPQEFATIEQKYRKEKKIQDTNF